MAKVLKGIAEGFEINIYQHEFDRSELNSEDDFYKLFLDFVVEANDRSEGHPVELSLTDEYGYKLKYKKKNAGDFQKFPDRNRIRLTAYYLYRDACYSFDYIKDKEIVVQYERYRGHQIIDTLSQGKKQIDLELSSTYDSIIHFTGYQYRNNRGHKIESSTDTFYTYYDVDEINDTDALTIRELTNVWDMERENHK